LGKFIGGTCDQDTFGKFPIVIKPILEQEVDGKRNSVKRRLVGSTGLEVEMPGI
jgi:hypothetical protein